MTKRIPVSAPSNIWFDGRQVSDTDLTVEQQHNDTIQAGIINNHIGNGVLPEVLEQAVLFDSTLVSGFLDGLAISAQNQPADNDLGNQLEIELSGSNVAGNKTIKVAIIGLDFQSNLQYETFVFHTNEIQVSTRHFTKILVLLFNDLLGDPDLSFNLGGKITIKEAKPITLSRSALMLAQDIEPNLFFRDFFVSGTASLQTLLKTALPYYNIDNLSIFTAEKDNKVLLNGDVTTQIGQKFQASTDNIQKITLLLSVRNLDNPSDLVWNGDLIVSVYPLQSNIECPTDIVPNLPIDFAPNNVPVAQTSINYSSLLSSGLVLDSVPQPIDFVFSNSPIAGKSGLTVGNYYAICVKRSGSANKSDILLAVGNDRVSNSRITTFTGSLWVDLPDEDLWFRIYTDAAKVTDGQAYDAGVGVTIPKIVEDTSTQSNIDNCVRNISFYGNDVFRGVVAAITQESGLIPDQRTGENVYSIKQSEPQISLLNALDITNLQKASDPLLIGAISDQNIKFFDSISAQITAKLYSATIVDNEMVIRLVDDPTDVGRFDTSVNSLASHLLNGEFVGAKIYPDANNISVFYRIADARLCSMIVGDVNGDGIIDTTDLDLLNTYIGYDLNKGLPLDSSVTTDGYSTTTFINGYSTYTKPFVNSYSVRFQVVDPATNLIWAQGTDGILIANPNNPRLGQFTSASVDFSTIIGLGTLKLVILTPLPVENFGGFDIISSDLLSGVITLRKVYLNGETFNQMLRADIDGDFHITYNDGYLLNEYIKRVPFSSSPGTTYPAPSTNPYTKIGTKFQVVRFTLEKFIDRVDDYTSLGTGRSAGLHTSPDIFLADGYFVSHDFYTSPVPILIEKQLSWNDYLVVSNSNPKLVPSIFSSPSGFVKNSCSLDGIICNFYPTKPAFDKGRTNYYIPDNLIIGDGGELQRQDGSFYKVDFEVGTIVLEIPDGFYGTEKTLNVVEDFIASTLDGSGLLTGLTKLGFPAMKFADCSLVTTDALAKDQVRFSVSVQSFSPNTNGLSPDGYYGAIVDGKMGVSVDYATGLLTLNFTNLFQDAVHPTLSTKLQINIFLKKGGFNNQPLFVDSTKVQNMLELISVFSGAAVGGPSALVDLGGDITGVLPIVHGGTGLNKVGPTGTVLTSNGSSLSYQFAADIFFAINHTTGAADADKVIKTNASGKLDSSFTYKNPLYIYGAAGVFNESFAVPTTIGALIYDTSNIINTQVSSIVLEVILETTGANAAQIQLYDITSASYLNLSAGPSTILSTTNTSPTFVQSLNLYSQLTSGHIYEVILSTANVASTAVCKMARLTVHYAN
jgi:hypothetical protein